MRRTGLELAGAQGRKETRNNQGKIHPRPGVGSGHRALQADLRPPRRRLPRGGCSLSHSLPPVGGDGGGGSLGPFGDLVSSLCSLDVPSPVMPCPQTCPRLLGPLVPPASLGALWEGPRRAGSSLGVLPSGSVPPSFSPDDLVEGGLQLYPPGPSGAGAADAGAFQEEEAGRGRKS